MIEEIKNLDDSARELRERSYKLKNLARDIKSLYGDDLFKDDVNQIIIESNTLSDKAKKFDEMIKGFQGMCDHKKPDGSDAMEYEGSDSHKNYYVCTICGKEDWY